jgi:zinc/manganese transport system substrate-binding protein
MKYMLLVVAALSWLAPQPARAGLNLLACEPEWAALAKELGGDKVSVYAATTARQDPHRVEARPSLIARARSADLMVCTGAGLEVGWVPLLQSQSGNPKIQVNQSGYFEAAQQVALLDVPTRVDRSLGDVHPAGNPHLHLNPANIAKVASALTERMAQLDPVEAGYYRERSRSFLERWQKATIRWEQEGAALKGVPLVVYHKDLSYLIGWLGMREVGSLEPKPGLPPTTAHLSELLRQLAKNPAKLVVRSAYNDPRPAEFLAERARIPAIMLPYTVGGTERAKDLFGLYDDTLSRLLAGVK